MANPATLAPASAPKAAPKAPQLVVPFTRAAKDHTESFMDESRQLGAAPQQIRPADIPAYGFVRGVWLLVEATGGAGGAATVAVTEDSPWNVIQEVTLSDVNSAPIVGPVNGYELYAINKRGGYFPHAADPKMRRSYSAPVTGAGGSGNFSFALYVPIQVNPRDGFGSLPNMNSASTYKIGITLAPSTAVYSTAPATTLPTVRVRAVLDAWTQPTAADSRGFAQATTPPAAGSTAYWSKQVHNIAAGAQTIRLARIGNYVRELILIYRDAGGSRANAEAAFPDPHELRLDSRQLMSRIRVLARDEEQRRLSLVGANEAAGGGDNGVYMFDFAHDFDGQVGYELRDGYLATSPSTRLEIVGSFGVAGTLTVITNDVAPQGEIFV